ncbi:MAG: S8 family serine peptidase [Planctomycetales bacterium]|nr:S8 family serine peptidase [Planctomycetales bacterium]
MSKRFGNRRIALGQVERLEDRQLLFAANLADVSAPVIAAFERVSELSAYSAEQLDAADQWVVTSSESLEVSAWQRLGLTQDNVQSIPWLSHTYALDVTNLKSLGISSSQIADALTQLDGVQYRYPAIAETRSLRSIPNDPLFAQQWYLSNTGQTGGTAGQDIRITDVWDQYQGQGVVIGVVDEGVEYLHPDLYDRYVAESSYDFTDNDADPLPSPLGIGHGTAVAGVALASANNQIGVSGVAPQAALAAIRIPITEAQSDLLEAKGVAFANDTIDVYTHSWGPSDNAIAESPGPLFLAALQASVQTGRNGLGNIHVWAAGNGGLVQDNVNLDGYANLRQTIAVGAVDHNGVKSFYSEPGASLLVTAYSSNDSTGVVTTDRVGTLGFNTARGQALDSDALEDLSYTSIFGGTSAAAPVVAGVVALLLEANPSLTWRDVQHILVESARPTDLAHPDWTENGAGKLVNHSYGFGVVDAQSAVELAKTWTSIGSELRSSSGEIVVQASIPDNQATGVSSSIHIEENLTVDWVEVTVNAEHAKRGDLQIVLRSPAGTESILAEARDRDTGSYNRWVFSTNRNWGEATAGEWTLTVRDLKSGNVGALDSWQLDLYGAEGEPIDDPSDGDSLVNDGSNGDNSNPDNGGDDNENPNPTFGTITGRVFQDHNRDGQPNVDETGLSAWTVFADQNANGRRDASEPIATTTTDGHFTLADVATGSVSVLVVGRDGWEATSSAGSAQVDVASNQISHVDFGFVRLVQLGNVQGKVHLLSEAGELTSQGVPGLTLFIDANGDGLPNIGEVQTRSDAQGRFSFANVNLDEAIIRMVPAAGWEMQAGATRNVRDNQNNQDTVIGVRPNHDYGDAPFPYPTSAADGGAVHALGTNLYLGSSVDSETDGVGNTAANVDDTSVGDDEDGIRFVTSLLPGRPATFEVTASQSGLLQGWIDFNADGDWDDVGEQIAVNRQVPAGVSSFEHIIPATTLPGVTYARFRISSQLNVGPKGLAVGGEVEDYAVLIGETTAEVGQPIANADQLTVLENSNRNYVDVLSNDRIPLSGATISALEANDIRGAIELGPGGGSLLYTPPFGFIGEEHFSYTLTNIAGVSTSAQVVITVQDVIEPIVTQDDHFSVQTNSASVSLAVLSNDSSGNGSLQIQSVSESERDAAVSISADGKRILYQPVARYAGSDSFTYTVIDAAGQTASATVHIDVTPVQKHVQYVLEVTDGAGQRLTHVQPSDNFTLNVYVQDIRSNPRGLFAAYVDVTYDSQLAVATGPLQHAALFGNVVSGSTNGNGVLDEVGGTNGVQPQGSELTRLVSIPMRATSAGMLRFGTNAADDLPTHQTLVFGSNSPVDSANIAFGAFDLRIASLTNSQNPGDVNGDGEVTPLDALLVINELNGAGSRQLARDIDLALLPAAMVDVNGDQYLSPIDALSIINQLNSSAEGEPDVLVPRSTSVVANSDVAAAIFAADAWMETDGERQKLRSTAALPDDAVDLLFTQS